MLTFEQYKQQCIDYAIKEKGEESEIVVKLKDGFNDTSLRNMYDDNASVETAVQVFYLANDIVEEMFESFKKTKEED